MKKIIASAVAVAFAAPVLAADITITGDQEFSLQESNGASTSALDGDFNIKASTETANGLAVSADINYDTDGDEDGGSSLTISGPFGKIDAGDTSSALDAVDDITDWGYVLTNGTPNNDAAVLYTLPSLVDGLTLAYSMSSENNYAAGGVTEGDGFSAKYSTGDLSVRYGIRTTRTIQKCRTWESLIPWLVLVSPWSNTFRLTLVQIRTRTQCL